MAIQSPKTSRDDPSAAADETTPLLNGTVEPPSQAAEEAIIHPAPEPNGNKNDDDDDEKPLPKVQMFLLCFARLIEPAAFFGIFPFINKMIWENGSVEESDVGFYSGLIESTFSLTQMLLMISWGRAADRIGRKPVLVFSLTGVSIATALFGLSKTIWQMVLLRCCAGVFAGTILTVRAMMTENSTPRTQARAFSFFAFSGNVGIFLGPLIGGGLASPAEQYPSIFGGVKFFEEYPYALPTFVTGAIGGVAAVCCTLFVKETLKRKDKDESGAVEPPMNTWDLIKAPGVGIVLFLYGHVMLLGLAYTAVSPVFWFTSPSLGGYGFTPLQISYFLAAIGVSQAIWLLIFFPPLQRRFGTGGVLRACLIAWPIFFTSAPLCNAFLRWEEHGGGGGWRTLFWIVAPTLQLGGAGVAMAFTAVQLTLNDISPSPTTLGTLNALALTLVSGIRTVGPALFTSLFAAGARTQILNGYLVWLVLVIIAVLGTVSVRWLPEKAEGKIKPKSNGREDANGEEG